MNWSVPFSFFLVALASYLPLYVNRSRRQGEASDLSALFFAVVFLLAFSGFAVSMVWWGLTA